MKNCPSCATAAENENLFCPSCGTSLDEAAPSLEEDSVEPLKQETAALKVNQKRTKKARNKKPLITATSIILFLGIVAIIGALTDWFGLMPPLAGLYKAVQNTLASESLTLSFTESYRDGDGYSNSTKYNFKFVIDRENETFLLLSESEDGHVTLYSGDSEYIYKEDESWARVYETDDTTFTDAVLDAYDKINDPDEGAANIEEVLDKTGYAYLFDTETIFPALEAFVKKELCDKAWLKENLGFEKKGNTYSFSLNKKSVKRLSELTLEYDDEYHFLSEDGRSYLTYFVDNISVFYGDSSSTYELSVTVEKNLLAKLEFSTSQKSGGYKYTQNYKAKLSDVNQTEINKEEIIEKTKELCETYGCENCGSFYGKDADKSQPCRYCYWGTCEACGKKSTLKFSRFNGEYKNICEDCDKANYCEKCSADLYGNHYCYECFWGTCEVCTEKDYLSLSRYGSSYKYLCSKHR